MVAVRIFKPIKPRLKALAMGEKLGGVHEELIVFLLKLAPRVVGLHKLLKQARRGARLRTRFRRQDLEPTRLEKLSHNDLPVPRTPRP
jgi:hypothetical protein